MRHIYLFAIIFSSCLQAQLSISPSAHGDSFLFISNEILFVEKDIHLLKNNNAETEASIYLRKEAQLIQGEKPANLNSGNGFISLYQEGTSNAYDYNYWSLPVKAGLNGASPFGANIFEPFTNTFSKKAGITYDLNGTATPLNISKRWIYKFSGSSYADWKYSGDTFDLVPGEGFTMKGVNGINLNIIEDIHTNPGNQQRYDFRGTPNDGEISVNIIKDQSLLSGNPYPSSLDLKAFLFANKNTTGIAYFWDSKENGDSHNLREYEGGYGTYSPGANVYAPAVFKKYSGDGSIAGHSGHSGDLYGREFSPVAQGFFLIGANSGPVNFKNSHRVFQKENSHNSTFKMQEATTSNSPVGFRLNIEINETYVRQLVLVFRDDSTEGVDWAMDATLLGALENDAGWLIEDENHVINVLPVSAAEKIPLLLNFKENGTAIFHLEPIGSTTEMELMLFDSLTNEYHNISSVNHQLILDKGEFKDRFYISLKRHLKPSPGLPIKPESINYLPELTGKIKVFQNNAYSRLEINLDDDHQTKFLGLYGLNGQLVYRKRTEPNEKYVEIPTGNLSNAVYIIKLTDRTGQTFFKKVPVKN